MPVPGWSRAPGTRVPEHCGPRVANSPNDTTIVFASEMQGKPIRLMSGPLMISTNVTIVGPGTRGVTSHAKAEAATS